ncbi:MAG TPA: methyltransferase domain-containing protein [Pseudonocardiaceae bacterium]
MTPPVPPELPVWDGAAYAANTGHHRRRDGDFLAALDLAPSARVLDVGCGSGDFTVKLAALVPDGHVVGLDPQPSMLERARAAALPNQSFVPGTAQRLADAVTGLFDAVVSRAALQWVPLADHPAVLAGAAGLLRPGGLLRLEAGGGDNIAAVCALLDPIAERYGGPCTPWAFPAAGEYLDLVDAAGFDVSDGWVHLVAQRRPFTREELLGWLTSQCLIGYEHPMPAASRAAFRAEVLAAVDRLRRADGTYDVTYVRLDVRAHRR